MCCYSVGWVKVAAMGPTVVQIVVSASGPGDHGPALVVAAIVGAWGCWGWGCCKVLSSEGLGNTLLNH